MMEIFGAKEVSEAFGVQFSPKQLEGLEKSRPPEDVIALYKDTHMLFVGHEGYPNPMTVLEIRRRAGEGLFWNHNGSWYDPYFLANRDRVGFGWYLFRKVFVPDSARKGYLVQEEMIPEPERRPKAVETAYALYLYYRITGRRLLENSYAWCRDLVVYGDYKEGRHAKVGFEDGRLAVGFCADDKGYSGLGTLSCLYLKP